MQADDRRRILVTGPSGFVGRHLCTRLLREGVQVVRALRTPCAALPGAEDVQVGAIDGRTDWRAALSGVREVVHLAAHVHQLRAQSSQAQRYQAVNVAGTESLARAALDSGVRRFVFVSSVKVHGESTPPDRPFTERDAPAPQDDYGRSKWQAEQCLRTMCGASAMGVSVLRPPLVYGPGVGANFQALLRLADSPWPLPFAGLRNLRSLIYVENLVDAIAKVLTARTPGIETYLVSDQHDLSTAELVAGLRQALGRPRRLFGVPQVTWAALLRVPGLGQRSRRLSESLRVDAGLITTALGWRPPVAVAQALAATANSYLHGRSTVDSGTQPA